MKNFIEKCVMLVLGFGISIGYADDLATQVQAKLNAIRSLSAQFNQVVSTKSRQVSHSSGRMALLRPGRFRWQTINPMAQVVIADGKKMWVYDVDLEQVTVKKQQQGLGGTAGLFLSGYNNNLTRDFLVSETPAKGKNVYVLKAKSSKSNFKRVDLTFVGVTLTDIDLYDPLEQHTHVHLSKIKTNPALAASLFHFTPPKGVDVVQQ